MVKLIIVSIFLSTFVFAQLSRDGQRDVVVDSEENLMWQDDSSVKTTKRDWEGAKRYCRNLSFAGYSDWRLPKRMELLSIVDRSTYEPAIKKEFKNVVSKDYWSSTPDASDGSGAWGVYFGNGYDLWYNKSNSHFVRCVRDR